MKKFGNVLWGAVLIIIGLLIGGKVLGFIDVNVFFDGWWTLFIIIPSFIGLFDDRNKTGQLIGLIIGIALLLCCQGVIDFDKVLKLLVPTVLVIIGLSIIFKDTIGTKINKEIKKLNKQRNNENTYCATFAGQDIKFDNQEFKGADINAIFGGVKCDLSNAIINEDVVINCSAIFGGIEMKVPENVQVKIKSTPIFGGISDKSNRNAKEDSHTIYLNATSVFGGVELK